MVIRQELIAELIPTILAHLHSRLEICLFYNLIQHQPAKRCRLHLRILSIRQTLIEEA
jgi:hypothetical protein